MDYIERKLCNIHADLQIISDNIPLFKQRHKDKLEDIGDLLMLVVDTLDSQEAPD